MEEVELTPGESLIVEGEPGDCLYIVVDGNVRVHSNERTLQTLGSGKMVGELALLDPEPRSASVTAVDDAYLFRIDKQPLDEVMADRSEIALGIIRTLTRQIRQMGRVASGESDTASE